MPRPIIIGIGGGTGSGKTTIADAIKREVGDPITIITQDSYYQDFDHLSIEERARINFDHPSAFDNALLISHITQLKNQQAIEMPVYDYVHHVRTKNTIRQKPTKIIIIEGILIYENPILRKLMDIKIFVDTDADVRILRRIKRDMNERGRTLDSVIDQYQKTVRPMHMEFVEPSKRFADIIIPEGGSNAIAIDMLVGKIRNVLQ
ncbi:MAG: uridine kinase [Candidatus Cloacimonetes bacterium]|nr:uridine kinase [Candidatus Cloacimonadota bacterium]